MEMKQMESKKANKKDEIGELPHQKLFDNKILILGASHLLGEINVIIRNIINEFNPDYFMLELDHERYTQILNVIKAGFLEKDPPDIFAIAGFLNYLREHHIDNATKEELQKIKSEIESTVDQNRKDLAEENFAEIYKGDFKKAQKEAFEKYKKRVLNRDNSSLKEKGKSPINFIQQIRNLQWRLGYDLNILPGNEFFSAIRVAVEKKLPIYLIDVSLNNVSDLIQNLSVDVLKDFVFEDPDKEGIYISPDLKEEYSNLIENINNPEFLRKALEDFKSTFPELYNILIESRDREMANNILKIYKVNPDKKGLVIVGAGHFFGILDILKQNEN